GGEECAMSEELLEPDTAELCWRWLNSADPEAVKDRKVIKAHLRQLHGRLSDPVTRRWLDPLVRAVDFTVGKRDLWDQLWEAAKPLAARITQDSERFMGADRDTIIEQVTAAIAQAHGRGEFSAHLLDLVVGLSDAVLYYWITIAERFPDFPPTSAIPQ